MLLFGDAGEDSISLSMLDLYQEARNVVARRTRGSRPHQRFTRCVRTAPFSGDVPRPHTRRSG